MSKCPTVCVLVMLKIIIKFCNIVKLKSTDKNVSSKQSLARDFVDKRYLLTLISSCSLADWVCDLNHIFYTIWSKGIQMLLCSVKPQL